MSMALELMEIMREPLTSSWRESMSTTTRPLVENMCPGPSSWTWNLEPWILLEQDLMAKFSGLTTLFSDNLELATTGLRGTTPKVIGYHLSLYEAVN